MLELRPVCENCGIDLPNGVTDAMICSFECTFCRSCATTILDNVCPNCGGGFEKRPSRPTNCRTKNCIDHHPPSEVIIHQPVNLKKFARLRKEFAHVDPHADSDLLFK